MLLSFLKKIVLLIICFLSFQSAFSQNNTPTAEEIIERHLEAIGGREAISKIKTIEFVEKVYMPTDTITLESKIIIGKAGYSGSKKDNIFIIARDNMAIHKDNDKIVSASFQSIMEIVGKEKIFEELNLLSDKYTIKLSGQGKINDSVSVYQITVTDLKGISHKRAYNQKTGLLTLKLSEMEQLSYYGDYREVEGVLFPFEVNLEETNQAVVQYIKVNQSFDEKIFEWNDYAHKKMIGKWVSKNKKLDEEDTFFFELDLREDRSGTHDVGYFNVDGEKIKSSPIHISSWQLYQDTLMIQTVDFGRTSTRYFKMENRTENSFAGRYVNLELDGIVGVEKKMLEDITFYFKKEEE